jgi:hypothetical protein
MQHGRIESKEILEYSLKELVKSNLAGLYLCLQQDLKSLQEISEG